MSATGSKPPESAPSISNQHTQLPSSALPPIDEHSLKECEDCHHQFLRSYLYLHFGVYVCDECRDPKEVHELITRTEAKAKYLLKDCDLDLREPPLRYILKKNPYAQRGDMRLYLKLQIEERALLVHGSEDNLEEELEKREERRTIKKQKTYDKKMKSLRMQVRSSLYHKPTGIHEHDFGEPTYIPDEDLYEKECKTCHHKVTYEEM